MGKEKDKPKDKARAGEVNDKLGGKDYEKELKKLHGELVKLQQWVVHKGLKVCLLFVG